MSAARRLPVLADHHPNHFNIPTLKQQQAPPIKDNNIVNNKPTSKIPSTPVAANHGKPIHPSPPPILKDKKSTVHFTKGKLLGEGGFARCYEVWDAAGGRFAAKVVPKMSLKSQKAKQKLFAEIKIHQHLRHPNIVRFNHVFEDSDNVYMILELCENKTFVELLKKKKRLTEAEARYYLLQIIDALRYMHHKRVIHRDLKLGNLFLTSQMDLKIGDYGLATVIKQDGERKRTICGTPNYIAPEILFDREHGHSFEVDIWSLGVIMYTLLVGRPPFQTKDVKAIYKKIRDNDYEFPASVQLSPMAKSTITSLLTTKPEMRPSISELAEQPFFRKEEIPKSLNAGIAASPFTQQRTLMERPVLQQQPQQQFPQLLGRTKQSLAITAGSAVAVAKENMPFNQQSVATAVSRKPMSAAVLTPKQVNIASPVQNREAILTPKLQPLNKPTASKSTIEVAALVPETPVQQQQSPQLVSHSANTAAVQKMPVSSPNAANRRSMLEMMFDSLNNGLIAMKSGSLDLLTTRVSAGLVMTPKVFISKWIDYSNKYGLGYQLTNGGVGVHFNDSTTIILSANCKNFEYLEYAKGTDKTVMNRHSHLIGGYPSGLEKKVTLLQHFKSYMQENLYKASQYTFEDEHKAHNLDFLVKYMRTKHAVMFRLTNRIVQINFFDHTKLILSVDGQVVTFINRERSVVTKTLLDILTEGQSDVISRLKYARDILASLTNNAAAAAAGSTGKE